LETVGRDKEHVAVAISKALLGKIFISHSSLDKRFVRKLESAIKRAGFSVWLDEHELIPGDPVSERIADALKEARVVIVVVSDNSIKSKWLKYELNLATSRMIKGDCRVIPAVLESGSLPPEVAGLLYADFKTSFPNGVKGILTALSYEASRAERNERFSVRAERLIERVFGGRGSVSLIREYQSKDYEIIELDVPNYEDDYTSVVYEVVSSYGSAVKPLTDAWWNDYKTACEELDEDLFLLITERPVQFRTRKASGQEKATYRALSVRYNNLNAPQVVIADMSKSNQRIQGVILEDAKNLLLQLAKRMESKGKKSRRHSALIVYRRPSEKD
jgi:hypothetical protein